MGRFLRLQAGRLVSFDEAAGGAIYDQIYSVGSTITTGTPITLPSGQTYVADGSLKVHLNGVAAFPVSDFNYVNSTQVSFTFDLIAGDQIRFRIN